MSDQISELAIDGFKGINLVDNPMTLLPPWRSKTPVQVETNSCLDVYGHGSSVRVQPGKQLLYPSTGSSLFGQVYDLKRVRLKNAGENILIVAEDPVSPTPSAGRRIPPLSYITKYHSLKAGANYRGTRYEAVTSAALRTSNRTEITPLGGTVAVPTNDVILRQNDSDTTQPFVVLTQSGGLYSEALSAVALAEIGFMSEHRGYVLITDGKVIRWSKYLDYTTWPAANAFDVKPSSVPSKVVGLKNIGDRTYVIRQNSIMVLSGSSDTVFSLSETPLPFGGFDARSFDNMNGKLVGFINASQPDDSSSRPTNVVIMGLGVQNNAEQFYGTGFDYIGTKIKPALSPPSYTDDKAWAYTKFWPEEDLLLMVSDAGGCWSRTQNLAYPVLSSRTGYWWMWNQGPFGSYGSSATFDYTISAMERAFGTIVCGSGAGTIWQFDKRVPYKGNGAHYSLPPIYFPGDNRQFSLEWIKIEGYENFPQSAHKIYVSYDYPTVFGTGYYLSDYLLGYSNFPREPVRYEPTSVGSFTLTNGSALIRTAGRVRQSSLLNIKIAFAPAIGTTITKIVLGLRNQGEES